MKKTVVISMKKILKKIFVLLLTLLLITTVLSFRIPQQICTTIAANLLTEQEHSLMDQISRLFSFKSQNTVYAAMPIQRVPKSQNEIPLTEKNPETVQNSAPQGSPPPETNLNKDIANQQNINVKNHTGKVFDVSQLLQNPLSYQADSKNYKVLLVHTHTTECYFPNDRSDNPEENMIAVGKEFQKVLEANQIPTLHITTVHDVPYTTSYKKSLESVTKALQEYPSIEVVIDLHRDAIYGASGEKVRPIANINGTDCAQVMLVCGTDEGGLPHPDWKENLSFALKIQSKMQENHPNLARPLDLRKERFNTHTTKKSVIFEIGSHGNTLEEAISGAKLAAQSVADVLNHR